MSFIKGCDNFVNILHDKTLAVYTDIKLPKVV